MNLSYRVSKYFKQVNILTIRFVAILLSGVTSVVHSDDLDIYSFATNTKNSNVLFLMDDSRSMAHHEDHYWSPGDDPSRFENMKKIVDYFLANMEDYNIGLAQMYNHDSSNPFKANIMQPFQDINANRDRLRRTAAGLDISWYRGRYGSSRNVDSYLPLMFYLDDRTALAEVFLNVRGYYKYGYDGFNKPENSSCSANHVVLLSDGYPSYISSGTENYINSISGEHDCLGEAAGDIQVKFDNIYQGMGRTCANIVAKRMAEDDDIFFHSIGFGVSENRYYEGSGFAGCSRGRVDMRKEYCDWDDEFWSSGATGRNADPEVTTQLDTHPFHMRNDNWNHTLRYVARNGSKPDGGMFKAADYSFGQTNPSRNPACEGKRGYEALRCDLEESLTNTTQVPTTVEAEPVSVSAFSPSDSEGVYSGENKINVVSTYLQDQRLWRARVTKEGASWVFPQSISGTRRIYSNFDTSDVNIDNPSEAKPSALSLLSVEPGAQTVAVNYLNVLSGESSGTTEPRTQGYEDIESCASELILRGKYNDWNDWNEAHVFDCPTTGIYTKTIDYNPDVSEHRFRIGTADWGINCAAGDTPVINSSAGAEVSCRSGNSTWEVPALGNSSEYVFTLDRKNGDYIRICTAPDDFSSYFVKGEFNNWGSVNRLTRNSNGVYKTTVRGLEAGVTYKFKVAQDGWERSGCVYGRTNDSPHTGDDTFALYPAEPGGAGSIRVKVEEDGDYLFSLNFSNKHMPAIRITKVQRNAGGDAWNYVLGYEQDGVTVRKGMGDVIHGRPVWVNYDNEGAQNVAYVGTNEGYIHAIDTSDGDELWAMIPRKLLKTIPFIAKNNGSDHIYGMDGDLKYAEYTDADGVKTKMLYAGMRRGGSRIYGLDITNANQANGGPVLKFVLGRDMYNGGGSSDASVTEVNQDNHCSPAPCYRYNGFQLLGQTWSEITPAKVEIDGTPTDVIIFSGGYNTNQDGDGYENDCTADMYNACVGAAVFIVDALTGYPYAVFSRDGDGINGKFNDKAHMVNSIPGGVAVVYDRKRLQDRIAKLLYFADTGGQVFRISLASNLTRSKVFRLASVGAREILEERSNSRVSENRRFYQRPDVALISAETPYYAVAVGTGHRPKPDSVAVNGDRFFVLKDEKGYSDPTDADEAKEADLLDVSDLGVLCGANGGIFSDIDGCSKDLRKIVSQNLNGVGGQEPKLGWYYTLKHEGQKVMSNSAIVNGVIYFSTLEPGVASSLGSCGANTGKSRMYQLELASGLPPLRNDQIVQSDPAERMVSMLDKYHATGVGSIASTAYAESVRDFQGLPSNIDVVMTARGAVVDSGFAQKIAPPIGERLKGRSEWRFALKNAANNH